MNFFLPKNLTGSARFQRAHFGFQPKWGLRRLEAVGGTLEGCAPGRFSVNFFLRKNLTGSTRFQRAHFGFQPKWGLRRLEAVGCTLEGCAPSRFSVNFFLPKNLTAAARSSAVLAHQSIPRSGFNVSG